MNHFHWLMIYKLFSSGKTSLFLKTLLLLLSKRKKEKESNLICTYHVVLIYKLGVIWAKFLIGFELFSLFQDYINIK